MNKLIFLGTGSAASLTRQLNSFVLMIGSNGYMIDCGDGMGTVRNIYKSGIPITSINDIFLTHKHADHITGISQFLFVKLLKDKNCRIRIFGDKQTLATVKRFCFETHDYIKTRSKQIAFVKVTPKREITFYHQLKVVAEKVAAKNEKDFPCLAYLFIHNRTKIVFSADMSPNRNFNRFSEGADILIHECFGLDKEKELINSFGHSTARDAGELAQKSKAKHLILTHLRDDTDVNSLNLKTEAMKYFRGKVTIARDLLEVDF